MPIGVGDIVRMAKRTGAYGAVATTNDSQTQDVIDGLNVKLNRIWGSANWKWKREQLAFAVTSATDEYLVTASSGNRIDRILNIIPVDLTASPAVQGKPLVEVTERQFYTDCSLTDGQKGLPTKYLNLGMDANNAWKVKIWRTPSSAFTMRGSAKMVLPIYAVADIVSNTPILYFPNDVVLDAVLTGMLAHIAGCKGDKEDQAIKDNVFEGKVGILVSDQAGVATDETPVTSQPPPVIRTIRNEGRSKGAFPR